MLAFWLGCDRLNVKVPRLIKGPPAGVLYLVQLPRIDCCKGLITPESVTCAMGIYRQSFTPAIALPSIHFLRAAATPAISHTTPQFSWQFPPVPPYRVVP